ILDEKFIKHYSFRCSLPAELPTTDLEGGRHGSVDLIEDLLLVSFRRRSHEFAVSGKEFVEEKDCSVLANFVFRPLHASSHRSIRKFYPEGKIKLVGEMVEF
ncbi:MAG: hypothetical protein ACOYM3_13630, partial [Terrimicrobiaceae bacterium]